MFVDWPPRAARPGWPAARHAHHSRRFAAPLGPLERVDRRAGNYSLCKVAGKVAVSKLNRRRPRRVFAEDAPTNLGRREHLSLCGAELARTTTTPTTTPRRTTAIIRVRLLERNETTIVAVAHRPTSRPLAAVQGCCLRDQDDDDDDGQRKLASPVMLSKVKVVVLLIILSTS